MNQDASRPFGEPNLAGQPSFTSGPDGTSRLVVSIAVSDYDHVRDMFDGRVVTEGVQLIHHRLSVEEIFHRFTQYREWDVSEMSMAKFASLVSQGDTSIVAIPVFPSRMFRHSSIYVRTDGGISSPADLVGKTIGLPEWAQTAAVYSRGFLTHQFGLSLADINWVQAGVNQPGRREKVAVRLPKGVKLAARTDRSLNQMLVSGEVDAVLSAHPPECFEAGDARVKRLFDDYQSAEADYHRATGVFPIMHAIVLRRAILDRFPWLAANLVTAFNQARDASLARIAEMTASRYPVPWLQDYAQRLKGPFGDELFPYGLEPNRKTLEAFLAYAYEQGVCHRQVMPEELFVPASLSQFKV